ncbi:hypothetical protein HDU93_003262 [Gonapodya sp. JEL0774]|nr:hypothetical protein HDU93_003262 [Gonapodya sp. JEL0774]
MEPEHPDREATPPDVSGGDGAIEVLSDSDEDGGDQGAQHQQPQTQQWRQAGEEDEQDMFAEEQWSEDGEEEEEGGSEEYQEETGEEVGEQGYSEEYVEEETYAAGENYVIEEQDGEGDVDETGNFAAGAGNQGNNEGDYYEEDGVEDDKNYDEEAMEAQGDFAEGHYQHEGDGEDLEEENLEEAMESDDEDYVAPPAPDAAAELELDAQVDAEELSHARRRLSRKSPGPGRRARSASVGPTGGRRLRREADEEYSEDDDGSADSGQSETPPPKAKPSKPPRAPRSQSATPHRRPAIARTDSSRARARRGGISARQSRQPREIPVPPTTDPAHALSHILSLIPHLYSAAADLNTLAVHNPPLSSLLSAVDSWLHPTFVTSITALLRDPSTVSTSDTHAALETVREQWFAVQAQADVKVAEAMERVKQMELQKAEAEKAREEAERKAERAERDRRETQAEVDARDTTIANLRSTISTLSQPPPIPLDPTGDSTISALRTRLAATETDLTISRGREREWQDKAEAAEAEARRAKLQNEWIQGESDRVREEWKKWRDEKSSELTRLLTETSTLSAANASNASNLAHTRADLLRSQAAEAHLRSRITEMEQQLAMQEQGFASEMDLQKRLAAALRERNEEVEQLLKEMESAITDRDARADRGRAELMRMRDDAERRAEDMEERARRADVRRIRLERRVAEVEDFVKGILGDDVLAPTPPEVGDGDEGGSGADASFVSSAGGDHSFTFGSPLPPSSVAAGAIVLRGAGTGILSETSRKAIAEVRGRKTFTEVYTDYIKLQRQLRDEQAKNAELTRTMDAVIGELEEKRPILQEQGRHLAEATTEIDRLREALEHSRATVQSLEIEVGARDQQLREMDVAAKDNKKAISDLQLQVFTLVRELERNNPSVPSNMRSPGTPQGPQTPFALGSGMIAPTREEIEEGSQQLITVQLVTFSDLRTCVQQNHALLRTTRKLADMVDDLQQHFGVKVAEEVEKLTVSLTTRNRQILEEVKALRNRCTVLEQERENSRREVAELSRELSSTQRSRTLRSPVGNGSSMMLSFFSEGDDNLKSRLDEVQREFAAYRTEITKDKRNVEDDNRVLNNQVGNLKVELAKRDATVKFQQERINDLVSSTYKNLEEMQGLQESNRKLTAKADDLERKAANSLTDLLQVQREAEKLRMELSHVKAERDLAQVSECRYLRLMQTLKMINLKANETRTKSEKGSVEVERNRLSDLLRQVQTFQTDREIKEEEMRRKAERKLDEAEAELSKLRAKMVDDADEFRTISSVKDYEARDLRTKLQKAVDEERSLRERLSTMESINGSLQAEVESLRAQVSDHLHKIDTYEAKLVAAENVPGSVAYREKEWQQKLSGIAEERDDALRKLKDADENIATLTAISQSNENSLAIVQSTYSKFRNDAEKKLKEAETDISDLRQQLEETTSSLKRSMQELNETQEKADGERNAAQNRLREMEQRISLLEKYEREMDSMRDTFTSEVNQQKQKYESAHTNYLQSVAEHAKTITELSTVRSSLDRLKSEVDEYRQDADSARIALTLSQESWQNQKVRMETSLHEREQRISDLEEQNTILHGQFDQLSAQIRRYNERVSTSTGESGEALSNPDQQAVASEIASLRDVVKFLRRERDRFQLESETSDQENKRLKQKLDQLHKSNDDLRAAIQEDQNRILLSQQAGSAQSELLEKINELNIIRESNSTLRAQNETNLKEVQHLRAANQKLELELFPLRNKVQELEAEVGAQKSLNVMLQSEVQKWRDRNAQILAKYERIDPVEHNELKRRVGELQSAIEKAEAERETLVQSVRDERDMLRKDVDTLKNELDSASKDAEEAKKEACQEKLRRLSTRFASMRDSFQQRLTEAEKRINDEEEKGRKKEEALGAATKELEARQTKLQFTDFNVYPQKKQKEDQARLNSVDSENKTLKQENFLIRERVTKLEKDAKVLESRIDAEIAIVKSKDREIAQLTSTIEELKDQILTLSHPNTSAVSGTTPPGPLSDGSGGTLLLSHLIPETPALLQAPMTTRSENLSNVLRLIPVRTEVQDASVAVNGLKRAREEFGDTSPETQSEGAEPARLRPDAEPFSPGRVTIPDGPPSKRAKLDDDSAEWTQPQPTVAVVGDDRFDDSSASAHDGMASADKSDAMLEDFQVPPEEETADELLTVEPDKDTKEEVSAEDGIMETPENYATIVNGDVAELEMLVPTGSDETEADVPRDMQQDLHLDSESEGQVNETQQADSEALPDNIDAAEMDVVTPSEVLISEPAESSDLSGSGAPGDTDQMLETGAPESNAAADNIMDAQVEGVGVGEVKAVKTDSTLADAPSDSSANIEDVIAQRENYEEGEIEDSGEEVVGIPESIVEPAVVDDSGGHEKTPPTAENISASVNALPARNGNTHQWDGASAELEPTVAAAGGEQQHVESSSLPESQTSNEVGDAGPSSADRPVSPTIDPIGTEDTIPTTAIPLPAGNVPNLPPPTTSTTAVPESPGTLLTAPPSSAPPTPDDIASPVPRSSITGVRQITRGGGGRVRLGGPSPRILSAGQDGGSSGASLNLFAPPNTSGGGSVTPHVTPAATVQPPPVQQNAVRPPPMTPATPTPGSIGGPTDVSSNLAANMVAREAALRELMKSKATKLKAGSGIAGTQGTPVASAPTPTQGPPRQLRSSAIPDAPVAAGRGVVTAPVSRLLPGMGRAASIAGAARGQGLSIAGRGRAAVITAPGVVTAQLGVARGIVGRGRGRGAVGQAVPEGTPQ